MHKIRKEQQGKKRRQRTGLANRRSVADQESIPQVRQAFPRSAKYPGWLGIGLLDGRMRLTASHSEHECVDAPFVALLGRLPLTEIVLRYSLLALKTRVDGQGLPKLRTTWGKRALH
jgi:hypothetical protein